MSEDSSSPSSQQPPQPDVAAAPAAPPSVAPDPVRDADPAAPVTLPPAATAAAAPDAAPPATGEHKEPMKRIDPVDDPETFANYIPVDPNERLFPPAGERDSVVYRTVRKRIMDMFVGAIAGCADAEAAWRCASAQPDPASDTTKGGLSATGKSDAARRERAQRSILQRESLIAFLTFTATHGILRRTQDAAERKEFVARIRRVIEAAHAAGLWGAWTTPDSVNTAHAPIFCVVPTHAQEGAVMRSHDAQRARDRVVQHINTVQTLVMGQLRLRFCVLVDALDAFRFAQPLTLLGFQHVPSARKPFSIAPHAGYDTFAIAHDPLVGETSVVADAAPSVTLVWVCLYRFVNGRGETVPKDVLFAGPIVDAQPSADGTAADGATDRLAVEFLLVRPFMRTRDGTAAAAGATHTEITMPYGAVRYNETVTNAVRRILTENVPGAADPSAELKVLAAACAKDAEDAAREDPVAAAREAAADEAAIRVAKERWEARAAETKAAAAAGTAPAASTDAITADDAAIERLGRRATKRRSAVRAKETARAKRLERKRALEKNPFVPQFQFVHMVVSHGTPVMGTIGINLMYEVSVPDADRTRLFEAALADTSGAHLVYRVPLEAPYNVPERLVLTPEQIYDKRRIPVSGPHAATASTPTPADIEAYEAALRAVGPRDLGEASAHTMRMILAEIGHALNVRDARLAQLRRAHADAKAAETKAAETKGDTPDGGAADDRATAAAAASAVETREKALAAAPSAYGARYWYWMDVTHHVLHPKGASEAAAAATAAGPAYDVHLWYATERPSEASPDVRCLPPEVIVPGGPPYPTLDRAKAFWNATRDVTRGEWLMDKGMVRLNVHRPVPPDDSPNAFDDPIAFLLGTEPIETILAAINPSGGSANKSATTTTTVATAAAATAAAEVHQD